MLCFRDKTWCPFYKSCSHGERCIYALTPTIIVKATEWWGYLNGPPPISTYMEKPKCWVEK